MSTVQRLAGLRTVVLVPLVVGLGIALGLIFTSSAGPAVSSLLNVGVCVLITLVDPLSGFLVWLLLNPLVNSLNLNIDLGAGIPDLSLGRLTAALILVILLAEAALGKRRLPRMTRLESWMVLTVMALGVAALSGASLVEDVQVFIDLYAMPFVVYFVARNLVVDRRSLDVFLAAVIALGTFCAVYGIYTQLTGNVLFATGEYYSTQYTANLRMMRGLLDSPHAFGLVFSVVIPVNFYKLIAEKEPWKRLVYALTLIALVVALFLTYKRGAWLGTMAGFVVIQRFYPQFRRLFLALLVVALLVMWVTWDQVSESAVVTERVGQGLDTGNTRTERWEHAIDLWERSPVLGYGWDGFRRVSGEYEAVESTYLWVLLSAGLAGFVPFVMVLISVLREAVDLGRWGGGWSFVDRELVAVFGGLFVAYLVNIVTVHMNNVVAVELTWALVGAIVGSQGDGLIKARAIRKVQGDRMRRMPA